MQMFCGVLIDPARPIKNGKIVSAIRNRIAAALDIRELQKALYDKWSGSLHDKDLCLTDATYYESHLRLPTDVKLLWECCERLQSLGTKTCKALKERLPRNKYQDINRARLAYAKQRKHTKAARRIIGTLRSTIMEGSFGNQKQHYNVGRIAARNSRRETLLLFFGIQCANAAIPAARQLAKKISGSNEENGGHSNTIENLAYGSKWVIFREKTTHSSFYRSFWVLNSL